MKFIDFLERTYPTGFETEWYLRLISHYLQAVEDGQLRNLAISTPPQHGKSTTVSERFPAYFLGLNPRKHVILTSYSDDIAGRNSRNCRNIVDDDFWKSRYRYSIGKATETRWTLEVPGHDGRYSMISSGIGGSITGHTSDLVIVDDPIRNRQDSLSDTILEGTWGNYTSSIESRLSKDGRQIMIMTRWSQKDLMGRVLRRAEENDKASQWTLLQLAATNDNGADSYIYDTRTKERQFIPAYRELSKRFPRVTLDQRHADIGDTLWNALYMGRPTTGDDQLFPPEAWGTVDGLNVDDFSLIMTSWDCASKTNASNDFSANVVVGRTYDGRLRVLDVWKSKVGFDQLPAIVMARYMSLSKQFRSIPALVIEDASAGTQLIQYVQSRFPSVPLVIAKPIRSKIVRAEGVTPLTRGGLVDLPRNAEWRAAFIAELADFPLGINDDVVDAFVHCLKAFLSRGDFRPTEFQITPGQLPDAVNRKLIERYERIQAANPTLPEQALFEVVMNPHLLGDGREE